ncbi:MAG: hypothetical protein M1838_003051 [Thelocarpon superellum]|nr:MAG: hypothetical protein M1838_003051 [Thelocarpon superellum]
MAEVSATRLYLGNLPREATQAEVKEYFKAHGPAEIVEVKLMNGFGFIEYKDAMDAMDVVPAYHGKDFKGERLTVQFARGSRHRDTLAAHERIQPRPRRTPYRMQISGLPGDTSWQDLKDFARLSGLDVVYSDAGRDHDGTGFVEFETAADLKTAVEGLDGREFKGAHVNCVADTQEERPRDRYRSHSPPSRRGNYGPPPSDYDRRPHRGGYSSPPRHGGYRDRSPRRDYYESSRYRSPPPPPRGRGPVEDYPPPRRYQEDGYDARPPRRAYEDPYTNGHSRGYDRPPSPRARPRSPGRGYHDYDRRGGYW